jgi:DNA polymerase
VSNGHHRITVADLLPAEPTLEGLAQAARVCRGCDLYREATQTVFGAGAIGARLMMVGEMPGNDEDLAGRPFVGPAGRILDQALEEAGIAREDAYVTNVVKHFKWEPRGRRRLHKTPNLSEIVACRPWLEAEIALIKPRVLVCLGATAAKTLIGQDFRITKQRGQFVDSDFAPHVTATGHPAGVLRMPDLLSRELARQALVDDLKAVERVLNAVSRGQ